jgi:hypothetical protein
LTQLFRTFFKALARADFAFSIVSRSQQLGVCQDGRRSVFSHEAQTEYRAAESFSLLPIALALVRSCGKSVPRFANPSGKRFPV